MVVQEDTFREMLRLKVRFAVPFDFGHAAHSTAQRAVQAAHNTEAAYIRSAASAATSGAPRGATAAATRGLPTGDAMADLEANAAPQAAVQMSGFVACVGRSSLQ